MPAGSNCADSARALVLLTLATLASASCTTEPSEPPIEMYLEITGFHNADIPAQAPLIMREGRRLRVLGSFIVPCGGYHLTPEIQVTMERLTVDILAEPGGCVGGITGKAYAAWSDPLPQGEYQVTVRHLVPTSSNPREVVAEVNSAIVIDPW